MTPEQLDEIEARANRATEGPWEVIGGGEYVTGVSIVVAPDDGGVTSADAEFIASARTDVPQLVAEVRRLQGQVAAVREALSGHPKCDRYEDSSGISCGWKSAVHTITYALEGETDE